MECSYVHQVSKEEVIAKLKDDGDFDRLRRKIIQKLKHNDELRENIITIVKQSAALNREGAENMKPRQLSDDIYQEVGDQVMSHISDGLWGIIRSSDGMKSEITETVQSVYNKLTNPKGKAEGEASTRDVPVRKEADNNGLVVAAAKEIDDTLSGNEPKAPPGFSLSHNHLINNNDELQLPLRHVKGAMEEQKESPHHLQDKLNADDNRLAPGFSTDMEHKQACDAGDEDPDVPPGFG
ncbi:uncharacterized protein Pyn_09438 [Prunus yedoensis var. nudiflora]|uniref:BOD1/SHG1 domain-containing protein n=1 Tax=Prunus yedoensis var. nudiflora TaxID=2094558 RepID=A0A314YCS7_PRUYE|nr:uncharacterized protein Pyn_09438 [Prunus yedoensis var. nudiflora]